MKIVFPGMQGIYVENGIRPPFLFHVIFQKRVRVFHRGFKHEKTDESTRPQAECFYCFRKDFLLFTEKITNTLRYSYCFRFSIVLRMTNQSR